jgi:hypothetical protein
MKTGRLLKFHRPGAEVHAYLYLEGHRMRAVIYLMSAAGARDPVHQIEGPTSEEVEAEVRAWIEAHYPRD